MGGKGSGKKPGIMTRDQMREPSRSAVRLMFHPLDNPYQNLANAIVATAADDYRLALQTGNSKLQAGLVKFFHSEWYKTLTALDPDKLISMLHKEHDGALRAVYI